MELSKWTTLDLIGFARPEGMPMDAYRELRREKDLAVKAKQKPRMIWKTSPTMKQIADSMDKEKKIPGTLPGLWRDCLGTYNRRVHGPIGTELERMQSAKP